MVRPFPVPARRPPGVKCAKSGRIRGQFSPLYWTHCRIIHLQDSLGAILWSHGVSKIGFQFFPNEHVTRFNHLQKNTSAQLHSFSRTGARPASPLPCAALDRLSNHPFTFSEAHM